GGHEDQPAIVTDVERIDPEPIAAVIHDLLPVEAELQQVPDACRKPSVADVQHPGRSTRANPADLGDPRWPEPRDERSVGDAVHRQPADPGDVLVTGYLSRARRGLGHRLIGPREGGNADRKPAQNDAGRD